ncbi:MAG: SpoIID/LytB domain-containing protein [Fretibacterium sp.]|nr:SpoIID/LytB domain-containing protein [Fretibacterium sp.]
MLIQNMTVLRRGLMAFLLCLILAPAAGARDIYVRLSQAGRFSIASDGNLTLSGKGKTVKLGKTASLSVKGGRMTVGKTSLSLPVRITSKGLLRFNGRKYRGAFMVTQKAGLMNVLDVEEYLRGVLPAEVGSDWPPEALRAQAIISRTYALRQSLSRAKKGYDVVDSVSDQVYRGAGVETARTNQAVSSTAFLIVAYGKELAFTPFHSDSGGYTANNAHVWGAKIPYLTGVAEPVAYTSPNSTWSAKISRRAVEKAVAKAAGGKNIAPITEVRVSEVDKGGRAVNMTFVGKKGTRTLRASQFRLAVGAKLLKSTMLKPSASAASKRAAAPRPQVSAASRPVSAPARGNSGSLTLAEAKQLSEMMSGGTFTTLEIIDILSHPEKKRHYYDLGLQRTGRKPSVAPEKKKIPSRPVSPVKPKPSAPETPDIRGFRVARSGDNFLFYGRGWGHGVGLSQWGARTLAKSGWTAERILTYYYPGTTVRRYQ